MRIVKQLGLAGALAGTLGLGACSTMGGTKQQGTWTMNATDKAPAANGQVLVTPQKNGNTNVKVEVTHLAQPSQVYDGTKTYVVWLRPAGGPAQNLGVLNLDSKLNGSLETKTPFKSFDILVTAEPDSTVTHPSANRVFNASVEVPT